MDFKVHGMGLEQCGSKIAGDGLVITVCSGMTWSSKCFNWKSNSYQEMTALACTFLECREGDDYGKVIR